MLFEFIEVNRDEIIRRCRAKVAMRSMPPPTVEEIDHGVPVFLDQLGDALRGQGSSPDIGRSAVLHAHNLLLQGFTVSQVVHDYGDICQAITELAVALDAPINTDDFRLLNRCLDEAIAAAVTQYGRERNQSALDEETTRVNERFGFFVHELRNLLNTAIAAFKALKTGNVGVGGSTGMVLERSLLGSCALIERSVAEVRLSRGVQNFAPVRVSELVGELARAGSLEAEARGIRLVVPPLEDAMVIRADRQILEAVVANLLQNAFKFTRPGTEVVMRVGASAERVQIEVEDECGGLPTAQPGELFRPYEQRSVDRTGLGLGLAFCRWGAEINNGRIHARSLPGKGCVFTLDLPRVPEAAVTGGQ